jgi:uncharacterized protein with HEPN domain
MSSRPIKLLIEDLWEAIEKIELYTRGITQDAFKNDQKTVDAVVRNLEIIGEASSRLPEEFKEEHSATPWKQIVGLRHRIVHEYFGVDLEIVWQILKKNLPEFKSALQQIKASLSEPTLPPK